METAKVSKSHQILNKAFLRKKEQNPAYSGRSLARDLGVSPVFVAKVLKGEKHIPLSRIRDFCRVLSMDTSLQESFASAVIVDSLPTPELKKLAQRTGLKPSHLDQFKRMPSKKFSVLNEWYHTAILNLLTCEGPHTPRSIAERLSSPLPLVEKSLVGLQQAELTKEENGNWVKNSQFEFYSSPQSKAEIRNFHRQMIQKAQDELQKTNQSDFERRLITGFTMAVNPEHVETAKKEILEFLGQLSERVSDGKCHDVYQCNIQLFPLTTKK